MINRNKMITKSQVINDDQWSQIEIKTIPTICQTTCRCARMPYIPRTCKTTSVQPISSWLFASDLFLEFCLTSRWWETAERRDEPEEAEALVARAGERIGGGGGDSPFPRSLWEQEGSVAHSPFYMLSRFSSSHIPRRVLAPLLRSCDHSAAESLYERGRPGRHRLNPWLHLQRGLRTGEGGHEMREIPRRGMPGRDCAGWCKEDRERARNAVAILIRSRGHPSDDVVLSLSFARDDVHGEKRRRRRRRKSSRKRRTRNEGQRGRGSGRRLR